MPYATAVGCKSGSANGTANIDLIGTPFAVDDPFALRGFRPVGSTTFSSNDQVVNATGGGFCGSNGPTVTRFFLVNDRGHFSLNLTYIGPVAEENEAPIAVAGDDQTVEATSANGATVNLDGGGSSDPDEDGLIYSWSAAGITFDDAASETPSATFPLGSTEVTLVVNDGTVDSEADTVVITVEDTTAPEISELSADPSDMACQQQNGVRHRDRGGHRRR